MVCKTKSNKAITRGVIVVDAGLEGLVSELQDRNFIVIPIEQPLEGSDTQTKRILLSGRILVTSTPDDFEWDASSFAIKIIDVRAIVNLTTQQQAQMISRAIITHEIQNTRHGLLVTLNPNGKLDYKELLD